MSDNNVNIGSKELGAVATEEEDNPEEFIGFIKFSTTGDVLVPRNWLVDKWKEHNLSNSLLPSEPSNWQAYRRTLQWVQNDGELMNYEVYDEEIGQTFNCEFNIEKGDEGTNVFIVYAKTHFPEDVVGETGGNTSSNRVGYFDFHRPEEDDLPGDMVHVAEVETDNVHYDQLQRLFDSARETMKDMKDHHIFQDINGILEEYRTGRHANAVEIRRSCYFVPAHHQDSLESLQQIWKEMNDYKSNGEAVRIDKTPVVNMEEQRELVARRVREKVGTMVDEIVGKIIADFEEDVDQTADQAARELLDELEESKNITTSYNELLGSKLTIKEILKEKQEGLSQEAEQVVRNALDQENFEAY